MVSKLLLQLTLTLLLGSLCHGYFVPNKLSLRCRTSLSTSVDTDLSPTSATKVGIIGSGSNALGTASLLSSLGHDPMLWSPSGAGTADLIEQAAESSLTTTITSTLQSTGALSQTFPVRIAQSTRELIRSNDNVLVVALPTNCHKDVMDRLAPDIIEWVMESKQKMRIIISSHASLGAVYFMQRLRSEWYRQNASDSDFTNIQITCWGTTAITARKTSGTSVNVLTMRIVVDYCTVPFNPEDANDTLLEALFGPRFRHRDGGLLAISLSNLNPQNHLGIVLGNMSRMDPAPPLNDVDKGQFIEPWYQGKNITPKIGRLMEALDLERINIAKALKLDVRTIFEHFSWSFNVPLEITTKALDGETITRPLTVSEMNQQMHHLGRDVFGPTDPESRYVVEDVPYGLVLTVILGRLLNVPAQLHESGIMILSAMYGRDFLVENELLQGLGLISDNELKVDAYTMQEWKEMANRGYFREK